MTLRIAAILLALTAAPVLAVSADGVQVVDAWARAGAPTATVGAAYMTLAVIGGEPDRLVAASSPAAQKAELHTHLLDNGVMRMRPVEAIEVAPGEPSVLRPGGNHLMLIGLKEPLKAGGTVTVTLTFARAGAVTIEVPVLAAGAMGPDHHGEHHGSHPHKAH